MNPFYAIPNPSIEDALGYSLQSSAEWMRLSTIVERLERRTLREAASFQEDVF